MFADDLLTYYAAPGLFTDLSESPGAIDAIPADIASIVSMVQGLLIHEAMAAMYGVALAPERQAEREVHSASAMLALALCHDSRPLDQGRLPDRRVAGVCRHFATLFVAILRHLDVPARVRCGFANYFEPDKHGDHWVGEYWNTGEKRWVLADAQVDDLQRSHYRPDFDTLDVPRDRFLVAGDAWRACRSGADASSFGVGGTEMWGLIEVLGNVFQDLAALQKIELLPWGWYGLATTEGVDETEVDLVDRLAALSSAADTAALVELQAVTNTDERLRVPEETLATIQRTDKAAVEQTRRRTASSPRQA